MDGTVIPLAPEPRWRADVAEFRGAVEDTPNLCLAYVTGRDFEKATAGILEHELPSPGFLVCDVGTSVFILSDGRYRPDERYAARMREALGGLEAAEIRARLVSLDGFSLQPEDCQTAFKLSYFISPEEDHPKVLETLAARLGPLRHRLQTVYSVRTEDGTGLVDLLPAGVAKDVALHYLHEQTGTDRESMVYAGDSGNDLAAMLAGFNSIVAGNTEESLKEEIRDRSSAEGLEDRIYFSRRPYAGGVLEGCRHFGIL
jgi:HAD superfamily hydrolase (TIGR01484 family)